MSVKSFKTSGVGVDLAPKGLVLINTTSFSAVASQSFNNVFSATYTHYRILLNITASASNPDIRFRLRLSGTDASGSNYSAAGVSNYSNASTLFGNNSSGATFITLNGNNSGAAARNIFVIDLGSPFIAQETTGTFQVAAQNTIGFTSQSAGLLHDLGNSYDGFSIIASAGTITGSLSVYGYNK
jgi:hypothetical protein